MFQIIVCRCVLEKNRAIEIIAWFDEEPGKANDKLCYNSLVWSQAENGDPLLCVTGTMNRQIKVYNVRTKQLVAVGSLYDVRLAFANETYRV